MATASLDREGLSKHVEWKAGSIAVHWRGLSRPRGHGGMDNRNARGCNPSLLRRAWGRFPTSTAASRCACRPPTRATRWRAILAECDGHCPVAYLGDDTTDEDAFAADQSRRAHGPGAARTPRDCGATLACARPRNCCRFSSSGCMPVEVTYELSQPTYRGIQPAAVRAFGPHESRTYTLEPGSGGLVTALLPSSAPRRVAGSAGRRGHPALPPGASSANALREDITINRDAERMRSSKTSTWASPTKLSGRSSTTSSRTATSNHATGTLTRR